MTSDDTENGIGMSRRDAEMVAALAALEADDDDGPAIPVPPARNPAQVYSVRIPLDRIDQLRAVAAERGTTPSALMRAWVVERLEAGARPRSNVLDIRGVQAPSPDLSQARRLTNRAV
ncbi:hypothetical protein [Modestobacter lapidis]|nr:hypothetical protein [Modestobacter lapidis]